MTRYAIARTPAEVSGRFLYETEREVWDDRALESADVNVYRCQIDALPSPGSSPLVEITISVTQQRGKYSALITTAHPGKTVVRIVDAQLTEDDAVREAVMLLVNQLAAQMPEMEY